MMTTLFLRVLPGVERQRIEAEWIDAILSIHCCYQAVTKSTALAALAVASMIGGAILAQQLVTTAKKQQSWSYWCGAVALLLASIPGQYIVTFSSYTSRYNLSLITVCAVIIPRIRYDTGIHIVRIKNMLNVIDAPKTNSTLTSTV